MNQTIINKKAHNKKCEHMLMLPYSSDFLWYQSKATNCVPTIYDNTALHCYITQCNFGKEFQNCFDYCPKWPVLAHFGSTREIFRLKIRYINEFIPVSAIIMQKLWFLVFCIILDSKYWIMEFWDITVWYLLIAHPYGLVGHNFASFYTLLHDCYFFQCYWCV